MFGLLQLGEGKNRTVSTKSLASKHLELFFCHVIDHGASLTTCIWSTILARTIFFFPYSTLVILKSEKLLVVLCNIGSSSYLWEKKKQKNKSSIQN